MKIKTITMTLACLTANAFLSTQAHADWFIRGTQNTWAADPMQDIGNNTVLANDVSFAQNGLIKFDRFGDWSENYGVGGRNGGDIAVGSGSWDIVFYTDTKDWAILPDSAYPGTSGTNYHFRGTSNGWEEDDVMQPVAGQDNQVASCQNFTGNTNPRFKIDPNGGWGDAFPAQDVSVNGSWTRVVVDTSTNTIVSVEENLGSNCSSDPDSDGDGVPDSIDQCPGTPANTPVDASGCEVEKQYSFKGTANNWAEGTIFSFVADDIYEICQDFTGDTNPRFKVDPNGNWGGDEFPAEDVLVSAGWTRITVNGANDTIVSVDEDLAPNCETVAGDWFVRGTFNDWGVTPMTAQGGGVYTATIDFTSGGPGRFKVDDGVWGNPIPLAGDGVEVDFCARYDISFNENTLALTQAKVTDLDPDDCQQIELVKDFRDETIYFVFTDRFEDGNPDNNTGNNPDTYDAQKQNWRKYFGGDIQGLIDRLDYLQALGVTAIWTTPMVDGTDFVETELVQTGYHGYWAKDFFAIDEHLGDWAKFDELVAAMEERNMQLVMDFAPNHSTNSFDGGFGQVFRNGEPVSPTHPEDEFLAFDEQWFHHNDGINGQQNNACDSNFENCFPVFSCDGIQFCAVDWDASPQYQVKDLFGLADFAHERKFVEDYLVEAAQKFIDHGVKAFRIDAVKHMDNGFTQRFANRLNDYAISKGRDGIYMFGEWFGAGAGVAASQRFVNNTENMELLDFRLRDSIEEAIADRKSMRDLSRDIQIRTDAWAGREHYQTIFLDNHDARRTATFLRSSIIGPGMSEQFANRRIDLGLALVMTLPGVPTIYYGTEQYTANFTESVFNGRISVGTDPFNREMMPSFNQDTPAFNIISTLSALRKSSPAIQAGTYAEKWTTNDVLIFERKQGNDVVVVAINKGASTTITAGNLGLANGSYTSLIGSDVVNVSGGSASFNLSQNEIIVIR